MTPARAATPGAARRRARARRGRAASRCTSAAGGRALVVPLRRGHALRARDGAGRPRRRRARPTRAAARERRPPAVAGPDDEAARCGRGRCRCTSGSAAWRRARRSSRWPATSPATTRSARVARKVALGALVPSPPLLIIDLGRPERFYNMLRIFKPRSPMSMGAWALTAFGSLGARRRSAPTCSAAARAAQALGARHRGRRRLPRLLHRRAAGLDRGAGVGAQPAVPRPDLRRAPRRATGAAATRLVLVAAGPAARPPDARGARARRDAARWAPSSRCPRSTSAASGAWPTALARGPPGRALPGGASGSVRAGLALRCARRSRRAGPHHAASALLPGRRRCASATPGSARGPPSARDDEAVARMARARGRRGDPDPGPTEAAGPG